MRLEYMVGSMVLLAAIWLFVYFYLRERHKLLYKTHEIQRQKALIVSLKKQINAHFTVNVIYNIKLLAEREETEKVAQMCDGLAYLLRYANAGDEYISGMEELFVVQRYISIMEIRYHNKFTADFTIDDRLDGVLIPRMLVQPIVENAIVHGFKDMEAGGVLRVRAELEPDGILIEVADNGCGMGPEEVAALRVSLKKARSTGEDADGLSHVALKNIERRVEAYYGKGCGLHVQSTKGVGTVVTLKLKPLSFTV